MNPAPQISPEESHGEASPLFFRHRRKMQIGGGIDFALLALWINSMTAVPDRPRISASAHARPAFADAYALMIILTIVAFRGGLHLLPGVVAFVFLLGASLAVCCYR